jgi:hypothetical protein
VFPDDTAASMLPRHSLNRQYSFMADLPLKYSWVLNQMAESDTIMLAESGLDMTLELSVW